MQVDEVMRKTVHSCGPHDSLSVAARLMWDHDCGAIVVVENGKALAMITDRDICMCALMTGRSLADVRVEVAMSRALYVTHPTDSLDVVESLMRENRIRRIPVVDETHAVVGIITLNDIVRNAGQLGRRLHPLSAEALVRTIADIGTPYAREAR